MGKALVPQPQQLYGMTAAARYLQWKQEQRADEVREKRKDKIVVDTFKMEERNLKALMRSMRLPEVDVLCEKPDEFSVSFLKSKGVYKAVKKRRNRLTGELS